MAVPLSLSRLVRSATAGLPVPLAAKLGGAVIAIGVLADLFEHTLVSHAHDDLVGGFPLGEHAAHLIVLVGMVLVLAGIVLDGTRASRRTSSTSRRSPDAIR